MISHFAPEHIAGNGKQCFKEEFAKATGLIQSIEQFDQFDWFT